MRKLMSWKKLVLVALCICMVFTLAACAGQNNENGDIPSVNVDKGQEVLDPEASVSKIVNAIFSNVTSDRRYLNTSFNGDLKVDVGSSKVLDLNIDLNMSIDRQNASQSRFSLVVDKKGSKETPNKMLFAAYFDGVQLEIDNRGIGGQYTIVKTDIIYLADMLVGMVGKDNIAGVLDKVTALIPTLANDMAKDGTLKVYEKYIEENNSTQITATVYLKETVQYIINYIAKNKSLLVGVIGQETYDNIIGVLNKVHNAMPSNSAIDVAVSVIGADKSYDLVDGSFKVRTNWISLGLNTTTLSFADNSVNIKKPNNKPAAEDIAEAKLGGFSLDVAVGMEVTDGKISVADIDNALGGVLKGFTAGMDIDFSKNYIEITGNHKVDLRVSLALQLDIKDNDNTNMLAEIYFDKNGNEKYDSPVRNEQGEIVKTIDDALLQIYYVGKDSAFYVDLTGLGQSKILPNKLKVSEDANGNPINLTNLFNKTLTGLIQNKGQFDFSTMIRMVASMTEPNGEISDAKVNEINQKVLNSSLIFEMPNDATAQAGPNIDPMSIVKVILEGLEFERNSAEVLNGIRIQVTNQMFKQIFKDMGMDITILDGADIQLNVSQASGLHLGVKLSLDANKYIEDNKGNVVSTAYPTFDLSINANIKPFSTVDEERLPKDRYVGTWQKLKLVGVNGADGKIDIMQSLLASLDNKKLFLQASVNLNAKINGSGDGVDVNIGSLLNKTIGGALGAAIAELQLRTGNLEMDYTLTLAANLNIASFIGLDTSDTMAMIKNVIGDQDVAITLTDKDGVDVLAILLSGGVLYLDASPIGVAPTKVELDSIFEIIGQSASASENALTTAGEANEGQQTASTMATVFAIISNIDVISIAEDELAIALNAAFLNNLLEILLAGSDTKVPIDLTMSAIGASVKFNDTKFTESGYSSLLNAMSVNVGFATDFGGIDLAVGVSLGGINLGVVDTNDSNGKYSIRTEFFANREPNDFKSPFENNLLNIGLSASLKLNAQGDFTFSEKKLDGDIGLALSNLALVLGGNVNEELTLTLNAAVDLTNKTNNKSQLALQVTNKAGEVVIGVYMYDKAIYVDMPLLFEPFKANFDVPSFILGMITKTEQANGASSVSALSTDEGIDLNAVNVTTSLINLTNTFAQVEVSNNLIMGIIDMVVGGMTEGENPQVKPNDGEQILALLHSLPFDVMAIARITYGGEAKPDGTKPSLFENLSVELSVVIREKAIEEYQNLTNGEQLPVTKPSTIGLGIKLGGIHFGFINDRGILPEIKKELESKNFGTAATIEDLSGGIEEILKDTEISIKADLSVSVYNNEIVVNKSNAPEGIQNDIILGILPQVILRLGALEHGPLINLNIHLAVSANIGKILAGDLNSAIKVSLGIYHEEFVNYDDSLGDKILGIVVMPEYDVNGKATLSAYIDAEGLASESYDNDIITGKIKLANIDVNSLMATKSADAGTTGVNETIDKMNSIVEIINGALSKISISNDGIVIDLAENIMGVVLGLITGEQQSDLSNYPMLSGNVKLYLKEVTENAGTPNEKVYAPGLHANVSAKANHDSTVEYGIGLALTDIMLSFNKKTGSFLYETGFNVEDYTAINELEQIALSMYLKLDVDLNEGYHILNLLGTFGGLLGDATTALTMSNEGAKFVAGMQDEKGNFIGGVEGLHLGIDINGNIGIKDPTTTYIQVLIKAFNQKEANGLRNERVVLDLCIYKDALYLNSQILNINSVYIPKVGISDPLANMLSGVLGGISMSSSSALSTADEADQLDFLIGDRKMEISVSKAVLSGILVAVAGMKAEDINPLLDSIFGEVNVGLNLKEMSAYINLLALYNDAYKKDPSLKEHIVDMTLAIEGLEVSTFRRNPVVIPDKSKYTEAKTNAFVELGANVNIKREQVKNTIDLKNKENNLFGKLLGVVDDLHRLDKLDGETRDLINSVITNLYIQLASKQNDAENPDAVKPDAGENAKNSEAIAPDTSTNDKKPDLTDKGRDINLDVIVQVNLDWNNWQSMDLHDSSFRLRVDMGIDDNIQSTKPIKPNTILDIYLIGKTSTLYIDAPLLGVDSGKAITRLKVPGINLIEMIEQGNTASQTGAIATADTATLQTILSIVQGAIGEIKFTPRFEGEGNVPATNGGFNLNLSENLVTAVAGALGLVPGLNDEQLIKHATEAAGFVKLESDSGIYIKNPILANDPTQTPTIGLKLGLNGIGSIALNLNHYALGVINDTTVLDKEDTLEYNLFKDKEGIKKLANFTEYNESGTPGDYANSFRSIAEIQNFTVEVNGEIGGKLENKDFGLTPILDEVLTMVLGKPVENFITANIGSSVNGEASLKFKVAVKIDFAAILENLEIGLTLLKDDGSVLVAIFYKGDRLYIQAPDYFPEEGTVMRVEHVASLFGGASSAAGAEGGELTETQQIAALRLIMGDKSVGIEVTAGVISMLAPLLSGVPLDFNKLYKALEDQFAIGLEIGSINEGTYLPDDKVSLDELYASLKLQLGPATLRFKASEPKIAVATDKSIVPAEWLVKDGSKHFSEVTFRVRAEGRLGVTASGGLKLSNLLNSLGVDFPLKSDIFIGTPITKDGIPDYTGVTATNYKDPLNLHLGLTVDAELCLGEFSNCNIAIKLNVLKFDKEHNKVIESDSYGELLAIYITNGGVYVDLENEIISIATLHIDSMAMTQIMKQLTGTMTSETAVEQAPSGAISTANDTVVKNTEVRSQTLAVSHMLELNFNQGTGESDLGSISAVITSDLVNKVLEMVGITGLTGNEISGVIKIDTPTADQKGKFGVGLNVQLNGTGDEPLLKDAGIYVWLGNIEFVKANSGIARPLPSADVTDKAVEIYQINDKFIHLDLSASLAMMKSTVEKDVPNDEDGSDKNGSLLFKKGLTEFFRGIVPWMPDFLAQLEVIGADNVDDFYTSHSIRIQANVNLGMILNKKTCLNCGNDFMGTEDAFVNGHKCPNCGAPESRTADKEFYLNDIDVAIEIIRNEKAKEQNVPNHIVTNPVTLLGVYVKDSQIAFYGTPFGLNNFVISKESVESIAKTVTSIIGGGVSETTSALSTEYEDASATAELDVFGILNNVVRNITITSQTIRIGLAENLFSLIPELTKMLGIEGFPEYGYPQINDQNSLVVGLVQKDAQADKVKIAPSVQINLDMFGVATQIEIGNIDLAFGDKQPIEMPVKDDATNKPGIVEEDKVNGGYKFVEGLTELGYENSVIDFGVEAELNLNVNKANTKLNALLGGIVGDINADFIVDETINGESQADFEGIKKTFILKIRGQVDISDYSLVLGIEIIELNRDKLDGPNFDLNKQNVVLGIYYSSKDATAYVQSGLLSNFKITGIELSELLGKLLSADGEATAPAPELEPARRPRPVIDHNAIREGNSDIPSVKVTIALQQYLAVAISGEIITQVLNGINLGASLPVLPDFEVGIKVGRNKIGENEYDPFAITLQIGLGDNGSPEYDSEGNVTKSGFLIDLDANIYLGPIKNKGGEVQGGGVVDGKIVGGTYVNVIKPTDTNPETGNYKIITSTMKEYPTLLNIRIDSEGNIVPEVPDNGVDTIKLNLKLFVDMAHHKGTYDFGSLFGSIFGENNELTAIVNAAVDKELDLEIDIAAQISLKYLILPLISGGDFSLKNTSAQIKINKTVHNKEVVPETTKEVPVLELTIIGAGTNNRANDEISIYVPRTTFGSTDKPFAIKIDTINIMDMIKGTASASQSLSTATTGPMDSMVAFINQLVSAVRITHEVDKTGDEITADYINLNVDFAPHIFDNIIKLIPVLVSSPSNTMDSILNVISGLNLPVVTYGGLYIDFNQLYIKPEKEGEVGKYQTGIGAGVDVELNNSVGLLVGLELNGLEVKTQSESIAPTATEKDGTAINYQSLKDLQLKLDFKGSVEVQNTYSGSNPDSHPISLGSLISKVLGMVTNNPSANLDLDLNIQNTEKYDINLEGYLDLTDFQLDEDGNAPATKNSKILLELYKHNLVSHGTDGVRAPILQAYIDLNKKGVFLDLTGMNLPKLAIGDLDLAQMLGEVISTYIGGQPKKAKATATAPAGDDAFAPSPLMPLLYLGLDKSASVLRFNTDLINGLLDMILGMVLPGDSPLQGLRLPDMGQVEIETNDKSVDAESANKPIFSLNVYRVPGNKTNNFMKIALDSAKLNVISEANGNTADNELIGQFNTKFTKANLDSYPVAFSITDELQLKQVLIDADLKLSLDFNDPNAGDYSFTRYLSRVLAGLIDGNENPENLAKYEVLIVGENTVGKKLEYRVSVRGILDITDIFGKSNLAIEIWKTDLVNNKDIMLIGAYLKEDTDTKLPTLYADLNNLGLPRVKLVGINSLFGGGASEAVSVSDVLGTGDYEDAKATAQQIYNGIVIQDNKFELQLNQGFIYGILANVASDIFRDGYIQAGALTIPLPNIKGVSVGLDLNGGLKALNIKAGLEQNTDNHINIGLNLNQVVLADENSLFTSGYGKSNTVDWNDIKDKYNAKIYGADYFQTFGAVHIGTSFKTDMMNSIVEALAPNLLIDYQKRGDSYYTAALWNGTSAYDASMGKNVNVGYGWDWKRVGQSWTQILVNRASGGAASNLRLQILAQNGANNKEINGLLATQGADVYLTPTGQIHANLEGALTLADLAANLVGVIKNLTIDAGLNIGGMVFPDASAMAMSYSALSTGQEEFVFDPLGKVTANLDISKLIQKISIRIYTGKKNAEMPKTVLQVKLDPVTINDLFTGVNTMIASIFKPAIKTNPNYVFKPTDLGQFLLKDFMPTINGTLADVLNIKGQVQSELLNLVASLLPLPELNLNAGDKYKMPLTNDQETGFENVRSEINIKLNYAPDSVKTIGALEMISAEFGNPYGFTLASLDPNERSKNLHYKNENPNAVEGSKEKLGYARFVIKGQGGKPVGFKAVKEVTAYNNGGEAALEKVASEYYKIADKRIVQNPSKSIEYIIDDPLKSVEEIKRDIIKSVTATLPTKADVIYTDGTSTGQNVSKDMDGTAHPVTIIWDDSHININPNGSVPGENVDNYLLGWVQNQLIAKIPITVSNKLYELKDIEGFAMYDPSEMDAIEFTKRDANEPIDLLPDKYANLKITIDSYITKNLPKTITLTQGEGLSRVYSTTAVKRIVYRSLDGTRLYNTETEEGLTKIFDKDLGKMVDVEELGWQGDWYVSKDNHADCAGKLEWDTSNVNWSTINPYKLNAELGQSTVTMKLITGKFDDFVLKNIPIEVSSYIEDAAIIRAINTKLGKAEPSGDLIEIDLMDMPKFMEVFNKIQLEGLDIYIEKVVKVQGAPDEIVASKLHISPAEIQMDFTELNNWLSSNNKYSGTSVVNIVRVPITIDRAISNAKNNSGLENIKFTLNARVDFKPLELVSVGLTVASYPLDIILNPYQDFLEQMYDILAVDGLQVEAKAYFKSKGGLIKEAKKFPISVEGVNNSLDMSANSEARVKFDVASIYGTYSSNGGKTYMAVYVGSKEHGYLQSFIPVTIGDAYLNVKEQVNEVPVIEIGSELKPVDVLNVSSLGHNPDKPLTLNVPITYSGTDVIGEFDIIAYDKAAIIKASITGATDLMIDAIIGYKQKGDAKIGQKAEQTANNYLNRRVVLRLKKVTQIYGVKLKSIGNINLRPEGNNVYSIDSMADLNGMGDLKYEYFSENSGNNKVTIPDYKLNIDVVNKKASVSIGLFDFEIVVKDTVTDIKGFKTVVFKRNEKGAVVLENGVPVILSTESREFSRGEDGTYDIKFSFLEKLPDAVIVTYDTTVDGVVKPVDSKMFVLSAPSADGKVKTGTLYVGAYTINVRVSM